MLGVKRRDREHELQSHGDDSACGAHLLRWHQAGERGRGYGLGVIAVAQATCEHHQRGVQPQGLAAIIKRHVDVLYVPVAYAGLAAMGLPDKGDLAVPYEKEGLVGAGLGHAQNGPARGVYHGRKEEYVRVEGSYGLSEP